MKKIIIPSILLIVDILLILTGKIEIIDNTVYNLIISLKCDTVTNILKIFTFLGSTKFIVILNILIAIFYLYKKNYKLSMVNVSSIISLISNNILKSIFKRERPIGINIITEKNYSFPSGHAMISLLFYGSIFYLVRKSNLKYKNVLSILLIFIIIMICLSRIYLGVHFASDIIGGLCIAYILEIIIIKLYESRVKK